MGNGVGVPASVPKRQNQDGPQGEAITMPNPNIVGLARLAEARNKFMKTKGKKEVQNTVNQVKYICLTEYNYYR